VVATDDTRPADVEPGPNPAGTHVVYVGDEANPYNGSTSP